MCVDRYYVLFKIGSIYVIVVFGMFGVLLCVMFDVFLCVSVCFCVCKGFTVASILVPVQGKQQRIQSIKQHKNLNESVNRCCL